MPATPSRDRPRWDLGAEGRGSRTGDAAYFSGLTYRRVGPDQLEVHVAIESDGEVHEERLLFGRTKADA